MGSALVPSSRTWCASSPPAPCPHHSCRRGRRDAPLGGACFSPRRARRMGLMCMPPSSQGGLTQGSLQSAPSAHVNLAALGGGSLGNGVIEPARCGRPRKRRGDGGPRREARVGSGERGERWSETPASIRRPFGSLRSALLPPPRPCNWRAPIPCYPPARPLSVLCPPLAPPFPSPPSHAALPLLHRLPPHPGSLSGSSPAGPSGRSSNRGSSCSNGGLPACSAAPGFQSLHGSQPSLHGSPSMASSMTPSKLSMLSMAHTATDAPTSSAAYLTQRTVNKECMVGMDMIGELFQQQVRHATTLRRPLPRPDRRPAWPPTLVRPLRPSPPS